LTVIEPFIATVPPPAVEAVPKPPNVDPLRSVPEAWTLQNREALPVSSAAHVTELLMR